MPRAIDLVGASRERAVPILIESFSGVYRWHAKRTLRRVSLVRAALEGEQLEGVSMLEELAPGVGYVYYIAVPPALRGRGLGGFLLDDALVHFRDRGLGIVYAAVEDENKSSRALFASRGFRLVRANEPGYREGGLGAWGLRSKMTVVSGEVLLGRRLERSDGLLEAKSPDLDARSG